MTKGLEGEYGRIAAETGVGVDAVKAEIEKLKKEGGFSDAAALAVYKSDPSTKAKLGAKIVDMTIVPIQLDEPRQVDTKKGQMTVAGMTMFSKEAGKWAVKTTSFWNEACGTEPQKYELGRPYTVKARVRDGDDKIQILEDPKPSAEAVPAASEIANEVGILDLNDLSEAIGQSCFLKGIVGKFFKTDYGAGIELSSIGSNPQTIYLGEGSEAKVGDEVVVLGYVFKGARGIGVRGSII